MRRTAPTRTGQTDVVHPDRQPSGSSQPAGLTPILVTIREAAQLMGYAQRTIRRLVSRGEIRAVCQGRMRRIDYASLLAFRDRHGSGE